VIVEKNVRVTERFIDSHYNSKTPRSFNDVMNMNPVTQNTSSNGFSSCRCCGTCCKKGGPAFHGTDRPLIEKGIIQIRYLYTIRKGELVHDPIRGGLLPVNSEIIKIKSKADMGDCTFYGGQSEQCRIYTDRPLECRLLKCWDTHAIEEMYERDRLSRGDILKDVDGLWELVADHEKRCGYGRLGNLISKLKKGHRKHLADDLGESINYDNQLRQLVIEKCQIKPEMLDFLFGRPLEKTIVMFGLRICRHGGKIVLTASGLPQ
jgi:Fe-S-cluster containining protein